MSDLFQNMSDLFFLCSERVKVAWLFHVSAFCPHFRDAQANGYAPEGPLVSGTSRAGFQGAKN